VKKVGAQVQIVKDMMTPAPGFAEQCRHEEGRGEGVSTSLSRRTTPQIAAGKPSILSQLHELKNKAPPNSRRVRQADFDEIKSLEDLKEEVRKSLILRGEERARMDFEKSCQPIVEQSPGEYPPVLVDWRSTAS
jgi:hypothetical protein